MVNVYDENVNGCIKKDAMRQVACRCEAAGVAGAGSHQLILMSHSPHFLPQVDLFSRRLLFNVTSILALLYVFITIYCSIHRGLDVLSPMRNLSSVKFCRSQQFKFQFWSRHLVMIIKLNQLVNTKQTTFLIRLPYYVICLKFQLRQDIAFWSRIWLHVNI